MGEDGPAKFGTLFGILGDDSVFEPLAHIDEFPFVTELLEADFSVLDPSTYEEWSGTMTFHCRPRMVWELRKRGKRSHKNRRKRHGRQAG